MVGSPASRTQAKLTPVPRQTASVSPRIRVTSAGATPAPTTTVTPIGGMAFDRAGVAGLAATVLTTAVNDITDSVCSILSAVDGCRTQKFDVRMREERTPLLFEID